MGAVAIQSPRGGRRLVPLPPRQAVCAPPEPGMQITATPLTMVLMRHSSLSTASLGVGGVPFYGMDNVNEVQWSRPSSPDVHIPHSPMCRHSSPRKWRHDSSVHG